MNYQQTAAEIVKQVGGKKNISHLEHCSTRLRFTLNDDSKADIKALEQIDGVMGVRQNVQCQVIIGNEVVEVYDEVLKVIGDLPATNTTGNKPKQKLSSLVLDFIISIFQPLVPAIAGGGILKSMLLLISMFGWIDPASQTYQILDLIGGAPLYFLPILVAMTTANKLKVNSLVAVSAVGALILPSMTTLISEGTSLFSISVPNVAYASQVFPAILCILLYAQMEKLFTKYSPKAIRIFFVPMMSLLITVPITLLVLGPIGITVGQGFANVILFLFNQFGWVATAALAAFLPFMVVTGMHKAMIPYAVTSISEMGRELLYLPASLAHNLSESGACFAVAVKSKDKRLKSTALSAGISALFGITEPALYGVTILHKKVLYSVMLGSLIGGAFIGIMAVEAFALVGPGLASITLFASPDNNLNLVYAFVTLGISFVVSFIAVMFLWKEEVTESEEQAFAENVSGSTNFYSPVEGEVIPLAEVNDEVFSTKLIGEGIAIIPEIGELHAPADGTITMLFETHHAVGMKMRNGAEVLFHIGLETVQLEGKYFTPHVKEGNVVKAGDSLISFDIEAIKNAGYDPTVIAVVTNKELFKINQMITHEKASQNQTVMTVAQIGE
ncbi:MAG: beta-glucoside-specific PTS transporter subunit IIABC [Carnobacterium sp.]|uniref:beta-glucoside-specific PTS transporter subunit IIABC n=1 Tax=Carnobacterium sp. TaxID=48221 RepID=UPI0033160371